MELTIKADQEASEVLIKVLMTELEGRRNEVQKKDDQIENLREEIDRLKDLLSNLRVEQTKNKTE
jgi:hypothetical protein